MLADPPRGYFHEHEGIRGPSESSTRRVIQPRATCIRSNGEGAGERATEGPSHQEPPGTRGFESTEKHTLKNTTGYCAAQRNTSAEGRGRGGEGERVTTSKHGEHGVGRLFHLPCARARQHIRSANVSLACSRRPTARLFLSLPFFISFFPSLDRFPT